MRGRLMRLFHGSPRVWLRFAGIGAAVLIGMLMLAPGAMASVSNVTVSQGISSATSARASYTVDFRVSSTGGMAAGMGDTITLNFPAGTGLNSQTSSSITDTTTNTQVGTCNNNTTTTVT